MGLYLQKVQQAQSLGKRMWPATHKKMVTRARAEAEENRSMINEISNSATPLNASDTVPKQVLDLVDVGQFS